MTFPWIAEQYRSAHVAGQTFEERTTMRSALRSCNPGIGHCFGR